MNKNSKLRTGQFIVNEESNQITFLDARFYEVDGVFLPSVSTILDAYPKGYAFYDWLKKNGEESDKIRDAAGERGSIVHKLTEDYDSDVEVSLYDLDGSIRYRLDEWAMFERYVEFSRRYKPEILQTEMNLASTELGFAGVMPCL